ncbi:MAG: N-acetylneuraminate synthase [Bacteroidetes bacterium 41-46]|nr:MAG: N-acetylneuraminate synthase [Bacteroidetes bacterium 41-46]
MGKVLIIAEAGVNHNGSMELAKKLIDAAIYSGVDYIKFQSFKTDKLVSINARQADYQQKNIIGTDNSQYSMLKKLELSPDQHFELISYCNDKGIKFFSTAFDIDSINFLAKLKLGLWKIPSGEITNYPYLKTIALQHEPVILSTGMCDMADIDAALSVLLKFGMNKEQISILHCNTEYPTPMKDVNLRAMNSIAERFGVKVGYSDHTIGIEVPVAAVALGASIIEKHFTLDRNMEGPDHKASLEPDELKTMVNAIRNIEKALGSKDKNVTESEKKNITAARKSIVALTSINEGDIFTEHNLTIKRPGIGISPMLWESVIGQKSKRSYNPDDIIEIQ